MVCGGNPFYLKYQIPRYIGITVFLRLHVLVEHLLIPHFPNLGQHIVCAV